MQFVSNIKCLRNYLINTTIVIQQANFYNENLQNKILVLKVLYSLIEQKNGYPLELQIKIVQNIILLKIKMEIFKNLTLIKVKTKKVPFILNLKVYSLKQKVGKKKPDNVKKYSKLSKKIKKKKNQLKSKNQSMLVNALSIQNN